MREGNENQVVPLRDLRHVVRGRPAPPFLRQPLGLNLFVSLSRRDFSLHLLDGISQQRNILANFGACRQFAVAGDHDGLLIAARRDCRERFHQPLPVRSLGPLSLAVEDVARLHDIRAREIEDRVVIGVRCALMHHLNVLARKMDYQRFLEGHARPGAIGFADLDVPPAWE